MEPVNCPDSAPRRTRRRGSTLFRSAVAVLGLAAMIVLSATSYGFAAPRADGVSPREKLARLEKRASRLTENYRGTLVKLDEAKRSARQAQTRAHRLDRALARKQAEVAELAAAMYKSGRLAPSVQIMLDSGPASVLHQAALTEYLSRSRAALLRQYRSMAADATAARRDVRQRIAELQRTVEKLESKKERVARLIARYAPQAPSSSVSVPGVGSISAPDAVTARMGRVYSLIKSKFDVPAGIHCYRPDTSGEHPEGRACDFMLSSGTMPSPARVQLGYAIASWAKANASELGVMYIIYRQRIWDARTGGGWESMEDRGSITANHYDHVHISVF